MRIAVLMACHDRRATTLDCLAALEGQAGLPPEVQVRVHLLDDASRDGTAAAVRARFPDVRLLAGDGRRYWAGGMARAWDDAAREGADVYFWLNDDTLLDPGALAAFLALHARCGPGPAILVGTTRDPETGAPTYGGLGRGGRVRRLRFHLLAPGPEPRPCDTFNGNAVWVTAAAAERLGRFPDRGGHALADLDYGLRARAAGVQAWTLPGTVGACARNPGPDPWLAPGLRLGRRLALLLGPKGLPPRAWGAFCLRHGGMLGPAVWLWPYLRTLVRHLREQG